MRGIESWRSCGCWQFPEDHGHIELAGKSHPWAVGLAVEVEDATLGRRGRVLMDVEMIFVGVLVLLSICDQRISDLACLSRDTT